MISPIKLNPCNHHAGFTIIGLKQKPILKPPISIFKPRTILEMIRERNIEKEKAELTRRAETAEAKLAELMRRAETAEARAVTAESKLAKVAEIITL